MVRLKIEDFRKGITDTKSENLTKLGGAKILYNIDFSSGAIKGAKGFCPYIQKLGEELESDPFQVINGSVEGGRAFVYYRYDPIRECRDDRMVIFDENYVAYYFSLLSSSPVLTPLGFSFSSRPTAVNYRLNGDDVLIIVSESDNMVVLNKDEFEVVVDAPKITSMDIHYERLFATTIGDQTELRFSDDLDPTNWSESLSDAGTISMVDERGALKKVVSFNDYLYIFREKGISRLYASTALQTSFYLNHLFTTGGKIFDKTIALCGDRIVFVASDGIYSFDGSDSKKCFENCFCHIEVGDNSVARFFDGKYYLACHIDFGDTNYADSSFVNNALLVMDFVTGEYMVLRGNDIVDILEYTSNDVSRLFLLTNSNCALKVLDENIPSDQISVWRTGVYDFGEPNAVKVVRRIECGNITGGEIKIFNEKGESETVQVSEGGNLVATNFSGKKFGYEVKFVGNNEINNLSLVVGGV